MLRPTQSELEILRILWQLGSATVRELQAALSEARAKNVGYTTALKFLQIMTEKGLVKKDETVRPQVFRPAYTQESTRGQLSRDLLNRAFGGSAKALVLHLLEDKRATPEEMNEIERLLDRIEKRRKGQ